MKKVITTMSAMTIAAQFNGAQAEQPKQSQLVYNDLKVGYSGENNFQGSGFVDLSVEKTVTLLADNDASGTVTEGDTLEYRIEIINAENFDVNNVYVYDYLEQELRLNVGTVTTTNGTVVYGNNQNNNEWQIEVDIDYIPAGWYSMVKFEAEVVNLNPGHNVVFNEAAVFGPPGSPFFSDDPTTSQPDDPTLIDAYGAYPDLIFDDGFEGSASGGFF
jgi:uncharacterized repeat protein (TIGR01451 family)